ncbi:Uu.00g068070.m01.CDS01 [Anthostomella pinea]|uniref:Uu.00g068070.m01.CDS01 n=1 Tax=Anthostomella pinea TaxID=933095 RepID=A0AAI8VU81_9PEZI|nr:Uu.00g068070.m01.CDS01 [Anthostomella pinea]
MASYNTPPGGNDPNTPNSHGHLQSMYGRLHAARNAQSEDSAAAHDLLSRFYNNNNSNQPQGNRHQSYYGQLATGADSPLTGLDDFPPPAPTPPSNFGHSHHPPSMMSGLAPIGTMPSDAASKADQSANLLNLLKFKGAQSHQSQNLQANSQGSPSSHASYGHSQGHGHAHAPSFDSSSNGPPANHPLPSIHAPIPMPADPQGLLATLMKGNMHNEASAARAEPQVQSTERDNWNAGPPMDTQQYLLNLLHRPKPAQSDQPTTHEQSQPTTLTPQSTNGSMADYPREYALKQTRGESDSHESTPLPYKFGAKEYTESPPAKFEYESPSSQHTQRDTSRKPTRFDYTNPFDEFATLSPQLKASKSSTPGTSAPVPTMPTELPAATAFKVVQKTPSANSPEPPPDNKRRRINGTRSETEPLQDSPTAASTPTDGVHDRNKETVSEAMTDLAEKADMEAQEALARAEQEEVRAIIAEELQDMMGAKTDAEFQDLAEAAARDIKKELDKEENALVLEEQYSPEVAQAIRDIVDDTAAHGPVADSWESAEADEIVVIEDAPDPIIKVYNFPMKPWISITMQDADEPRPQFRDDVITDIARLKKDFDQIDRNLVSATELYIAYGMSKAGGLRVIRQEDGKDAKLFTDTKDRVFNVAVSNTPADANSTPMECIIGTGISGTVYYVQIKSGDKDHLDDPHSEQYGFALPPISTQEGDAPGGVLKTRARTSATHPEYFAVGRGKTISIIWPAFVMQKNIFKPGHDRVVDTEKLSRECALRINTGKAGKDFTFSQDDTTIVSLDKSGRVKFWDVRDLTAADENSDFRFPMPAHTSLEVKEPLMTLNTTPEGEKAWPTSVLLLDKQRPYQKRCALRYMIVGMKQNHTLQLWDLALGKPVQEFNLPHSKESDAVCSVMYHPQTGIIVVGHPTRNSIYFLHLSAPKYTVKGLSQVDFIQKLVAKDSSIPEPDSTAVISGVREYSFANKGALRSLDLLVTPTSSNIDEPSLFDLYAMHSKGVTSFAVKQSELGWSKDNKVINGVDAIEIGLVKMTKLKELPSTVVSEPPATEETALPIRIAARPSLKENTPPQSTSTFGFESSKKGAETIQPSAHNERKEVDAPVTPINQLDKSEKKARKKREKAAAAAAAAEKLAVENTLSNVGAHSPRVGPVSSKGVDSKTSSMPPAAPTVSVESIQSAVQQISSGLGEKLTGILSEFTDYRGKVETEFRSRENTFATSQKELLELVSTVLNENVQTVLARTISDQFDDVVLPHMSNLITKTIETQIDGKIGGKVSHSIQNQMQKSLPNAVSQALQKSDLPKAICDKLVDSVAIDMEETFRETLMTAITPIFSDMAVAASRDIVKDVQHRNTEQIGQLEQRHIADAHKIDQLTILVANLSDTVNTMASNQALLQDSLLRIQQQISQQDRVSTRQPQPSHAHSLQTQQSRATQAVSYGSPAASSTNQLVPFPGSYQGSHQGSHSGSKDAELEHMIASVASFMERGEFETGLVRWIQLPRKHDVFDQYMVKYNPEFMQEMPALVSLSVASVIAEQLDGPLLREKVGWVEVVLSSLHAALPRINVGAPPVSIDDARLNSLQDAQVRDVVPNIMGTFLERIEKLFMRISSRSPTDPVLPHLSAMTHMATRIRDFSRNAGY